MNRKPKTSGILTCGHCPIVWVPFSTTLSQSDFNFPPLAMSQKGNNCSENIYSIIAMSQNILLHILNVKTKHKIK